MSRSFGQRSETDDKISEKEKIKSVTHISESRIEMSGSNSGSGTHFVGNIQVDCFIDQPLCNHKMIVDLLRVVLPSKGPEYLNREVSPSPSTKDIRDPEQMTK